MSVVEVCQRPKRRWYFDRSVEDDSIGDKGQSIAVSLVRGRSLETASFETCTSKIDVEHGMPIVSSDRIAPAVRYPSYAVQAGNNAVKGGQINFCVQNDYVLYPS
jgi:hypothetical protein